MKIIRLVSYILLATVICGFGCYKSKPTPNPLADFHFSSLNNLDSNKAITNDYRDYIQKLPPEEKRLATCDGYCEDGMGQHGVLITVGLEGKNWRHVLIYDKNDKRISVTKWESGDSSS